MKVDHEICPECGGDGILKFVGGLAHFIYREVVCPVCKGARAIPVIKEA